jgi:hypothetical protein
MSRRGNDGCQGDIFPKKSGRKQLPLRPPNQQSEEFAL